MWVPRDFVSWNAPLPQQQQQVTVFYHPLIYLNGLFYLEHLLNETVYKVNKFVRIC